VNARFLVPTSDYNAIRNIVKNKHTRAPIKSLLPAPSSLTKHVAIAEEAKIAKITIMIIANNSCGLICIKEDNAIVGNSLSSLKLLSERKNNDVMITIALICFCLVCDAAGDLFILNFNTSSLTYL
jgi:hypothetical protein